jgi:hypothetical protein
MPPPTSDVPQWTRDAAALNAAWPPEIQLTPGHCELAAAELTLLLAGEGIDVGNIEVPDLDTLQQAFNRNCRMTQHVHDHPQFTKLAT